MDHQPSFSNLKKAASKFPLNHEVWTILLAAEENAYDTYDDTNPNWEHVAIESIGCLFDVTTKPSTIRWFKRQGYRW